MIGLSTFQEIAFTSCVSQEAKHHALTTRHILKNKTKSNFKASDISGWQSSSTPACLIGAGPLCGMTYLAYGLFPVTLGLATPALITSTINALSL
jgi:hypothetical protein